MGSSNMFFVLVVLGVLMVGGGSAFALDAGKLQQAANQNKLTPAQMEKIIIDEAAKAGVTPDQLLDTMIGPEPAPAGTPQSSGGNRVTDWFLKNPRKSGYAAAIGVTLHYAWRNSNNTYAVRPMPMALPGDTSPMFPRDLTCSAEGTPISGGMPYQYPSMVYGVEIPSPCVPTEPVHYLLVEAPHFSVHLGSGNGPVELLASLMFTLPVVPEIDSPVTNGKWSPKIALGLRYAALKGHLSGQVRYVRDFFNSQPGIDPNQLDLAVNLHLWRFTGQFGALMPMQKWPHEKALMHAGLTYDF